MIRKVFEMSLEYVDFYWDDEFHPHGLIMKQPLPLPETNKSPMKIPIFPCKYHQNGPFSSQLC